MNSVVLGSLHCIEFITTEKSVCIISFKICESNPDPVESKKKKQKKQEHNEKKKKLLSPQQTGNIRTVPKMPEWITRAIQRQSHL